MMPGTIVQVWNSTGRAHTGLLIQERDGRFLVSVPGGGNRLYDNAKPLNDAEAWAAQERSGREKWLSARPLRRVAFIEFETARAIGFGKERARVGLDYTYRVKCTRCAHVSHVPEDTWDHAVQCRHEEPFRKEIAQAQLDLTRKAARAGVDFGGSEVSP
jgi:hypothetical protein